MTPESLCKQQFPTVKPENQAGEDTERIQALLAGLSRPEFLSLESPEGTQRRNEQEQTLRLLFERLSTENPIRKAERKVSIGTGRDKIFEGEKLVQTRDFAVGSE